jgi:hypothetical protein
MPKICKTCAGHSFKVWMKWHQHFLKSSPEKFCDERTEGGEVIPICRYYSVEPTQKCKEFKFNVFTLFNFDY